jgi:hypothetical protein
MSERLGNSHERAQKTPEERAHQVRRISAMLLDRAQKLPGATSREGSVVDDTVIKADAGERSLVGDGVTIRKWDEENKEFTTTEIHRINENFGDKSSVVSKQVKQTAERWKTLETVTNPAGAHDGKLVAGSKDPEDESMPVVKNLTEQQVDAATAQMLMKARGAIAAHEIAQKQPTEKELEDMFN